MVGAKPDGIPEIIGSQSGHHRIQVDHTQRAPCLCVEQDIVQLGVIVRNAQAKDAASDLVCQDAAHTAPHPDLLDLFCNVSYPSGCVQADSVFKPPVSLRRVVKVRNRLDQAGGVKVPEIVLEMTKCFSGCRKQLRCIGDLIAQRIADIMNESPDFTASVPDIWFPVLCRQHGQGLPGRIAAFLKDCLLQILRDLPDILRHILRMDEDIAVDPLKDIARERFSHPLPSVSALQQICIIDMTVSVSSDALIP